MMHSMLQSSIEWKPEFDFKVPVDNWMAPQKDTYFFCDLHADAEAFLRSLKLSGLVAETSSLESVKLTANGRNGKIVIGGDCFDKGPSNLDLFRLIGTLKESDVDLVLLAGNHDIRIYAGLLAMDFMDDMRQCHFFVRMGRKTAKLFAEVFQQYCQGESVFNKSDEQIEAELFPTQEWFERFPEYASGFMTEKKIRKEIKQIRKKRDDFMQACQEYGLSLQQVYLAARKAKSLFVDKQGEFSWFFNELDLMHVSGSYVFSHAGLDDRMACRLVSEGSEALNLEFRQQLSQGRIFQMYYSEFGNVFRTKYRENDWPLTEAGTQCLRDHHLFAIVNGHRSHEAGQQLFVRYGMLNFECDTQLNANCRQKANMPVPGEAVTIFSSDGLVSGLSGDFPAIKRFHPNQLKS